MLKVQEVPRAIKSLSIEFLEKTKRVQISSKRDSYGPETPTFNNQHKLTAISVENIGEQNIQVFRLNLKGKEGKKILFH